jgi:hypothetical protein
LPHLEERRSTHTKPIPYAPPHLSSPLRAKGLGLGVWGLGLVSRLHADTIRAPALELAVED